MPGASPLAGLVEVLPSEDESRTAARFTVQDGETVLPGHYPGFPIFPGVCLVECTHLAALATAPGGAKDGELAAVESTRFTGPVFPGDRLEIAMGWKQTPVGEWQCRAKLATSRGDAATVRLRYRARTTAPEVAA
jgi:3-hydroxyacyl-[acyl-carrier-protein] dehydratase